MRRAFWSIVVIILVLSAVVFGQVTIATSNLPNSPGTVITMMSNNTVASVNLGPSGANQTWNYTSVQALEQSVQEWVSPVGTPFIGEFPDANRSMYSQDQGGMIEVYSYYNVTSSDVIFLGTATDTTGGAEVIHVTYTHLPGNYPYTYGDEWYTVWSMDIGMGVTVVDSTVSVVDGWGTLVDVVGSFQCLRVQNFTANTTLLMGVPITSYTSWSYIWMVPGRGGTVTINSERNEPNPNFTTGTFHRLTDISTGVEQLETVSVLPSSIQLHPAYPNPFNPVTNLEFSLPNAGEVSLVVFDVQGRQVRTLHQRLLSPGCYHVTLDASDLATGQYFARLWVGSEVQVRSLTLLK
jgi:hypothetical protein